MALLSSIISEPPARTKAACDWDCPARLLGLDSPRNPDRGSPAQGAWGVDPGRGQAHGRGDVRIGRSLALTLLASATLPGSGCGLTPHAFRKYQPPAARAAGPDHP